MKKERSEPTINEMCKAQADHNFNLPEVRKHFGIQSDSSGYSKSKSQPRPQYCLRIKSAHKRNPEETFGFNSNRRTYG